MQAPRQISFARLREYVQGLEGETRVYRRVVAEMTEKAQAAERRAVRAEKALAEEKARRDPRFEAVKRERDSARLRIRAVEADLATERELVGRKNERIIAQDSEIERLTTQLSACQEDNSALAQNINEKLAHMANDRQRMRIAEREAREAEQRAEKMALSVDQKKEIIDLLEDELAGAHAHARELGERFESARADAEQRGFEILALQQALEDAPTHTTSGEALLPLIRSVPGHEDFDGDPIEGASRILRRIQSDRAREERLRGEMGDLRQELMSARAIINQYADVAKAVCGERDPQALAKAISDHFPTAR